MQRSKINVEKSINPIPLQQQHITLYAFSKQLNLMCNPISLNPCQVEAKKIEVFNNNIITKPYQLVNNGAIVKPQISPVLLSLQNTALFPIPKSLYLRYHQDIQTICKREGKTTKLSNDIMVTKSLSSIKKAIDILVNTMELKLQSFEAHSIKAKIEFSRVHIFHMKSESQSHIKVQRAEPEVKRTRNTLSMDLLPISLHYPHENAIFIDTAKPILVYKSDQQAEPPKKIIINSISSISYAASILAGAHSSNNTTMDISCGSHNSGECNINFVNKRQFKFELTHIKTEALNIPLIRKRGIVHVKSDYGSLPKQIQDPFISNSYGHEHIKTTQNNVVSKMSIALMDVSKNRKPYFTVNSQIFNGTVEQIERCDKNSINYTCTALPIQYQLVHPSYITAAYEDHKLDNGTNCLKKIADISICPKESIPIIIDTCINREYCAGVCEHKTKDGKLISDLSLKSYCDLLYLKSYVKCFMIAKHYKTEVKLFCPLCRKYEISSTLVCWPQKCICSTPSSNCDNKYIYLCNDKLYCANCVVIQYPNECVKCNKYPTKNIAYRFPIELHPFDDSNSIYVHINCIEDNSDHMSNYFLHLMRYRGNSVIRNQYN
jgi:hypothetical protein